MATQAATTRRHPRTKSYAPSVERTPGEPMAAAEDSGDATAAFLDPAARKEMVERAAYFRAERRGFVEGCALQDWLEAEAEVDAMFGER